MSDATLERASAVAAAAICQDAAVLLSIHRPEVQLAIWERPRPANLDWIDSLPLDEIADIDAEIAAAAPAAEIAALLHEASYAPGPDCEALVQELALRAREFASLMACERLNMRLEVVDTDACRKFHMDYVTARLLMPLHGPGTQWIEAAKGSDAPINQLGVGDIALFKGREIVAQPAILHRSPPLGASGAMRLLFVLNPASGAMPFPGRTP